MSDQPVFTDISSDDKLWSLLAYIFSHLVPIIILLLEDKKNRPFIKYNNMQALVLGIINIIDKGGMFPIFPIVNWSL